ncbi:MAG: glycosyltransferase family 2 protein [Chloroflexota bacterium]
MISVLFWLCVAFILYTYFGYPLFLAFLTRFMPAKVEYPAYLPSVTLLVAACNEEVVIAKKLENCLKLDYPGDQLQILVAADGSDDRTPEIVRRFARQGVELSYSPERRGKMAAINRAMPMARGEVVVFSDANNMYATDALKKLVQPFGDSQVGAVSGAKVVLSREGGLDASEGLYWRYESFIKKQETRLGSCTGVSGEIFAVRRDLFEPPPEEIINDDFYIALRIIRRGYRIAYVPDARSMEWISPTSKDEVIRRSRIVAGRFQAMVRARELLDLRNGLVVWQVVSHKFFRPLVPWAMLGALLANLLAVMLPPQPGWHPLLSLAYPINWIFLAFQLLFYGLALLGSAVQFEGSVGKLLCLPAFMVNSQLAAVFGLFGYISGRQTALWERVPRDASTSGLPHPVDSPATKPKTGK